MIVKKYIDANNNPQFDVLATTGTRQWVGTEQALDAALANGTIKPGTVADTYMEADEPEVDYATVAYVNKNNKLAGWEDFMPSESKSYEFLNTVSGQYYWDKPGGWLMPYDGYVQLVFSCYTDQNPGGCIPIVQVSSDGGTTWINMYFGNAYQVSRNNIYLTVSKGDLIRRGCMGSDSTRIYGGGSISVNFYKERAYV